MNVLVCGGRKFMNKEVLFKVLDALPFEVTKIINGDASGADGLSTVWAKSRGIEYSANPADWKQYGRAAGIIRNAEMLKEDIDVVIAFPGGTGTRDMINRSAKAGVEVIEVTIVDGKVKCTSSYKKEDSVLEIR